MESPAKVAPDRSLKAKAMAARAKRIARILILSGLGDGGLVIFDFRFSIDDLRLTAPNPQPRTQNRLRSCSPDTIQAPDTVMCWL